MKALKRLISGLFSETLSAGAILFGLAFLVRLAVIFHFHPYNDLGRYELERTALSLATTGVYGNPYNIPTGPSAHVSPAYTLILAGIFHAFGSGINAEIVKELFATAVTSLEIALLPALACALQLSRLAGICAGLVMAFFPLRPLVEIDGDWEAPYLALTLMLVAALAAHIWKRHDVRITTALWHGFFWGVALLFAGALLPLYVAFLVFDGFLERNRFKRYLSFAAVQSAILFACLAPWIIRNFVALGSPVITRTNAGIELRISNNDYAVADQRENYIHGLFNRYHPLQSRAEALKVREMGEVKYNAMALAEARQWIRAHPLRFLDLTLGRIRCFWFYIDPTSHAKTVLLWTIDILGLAGLALGIARRQMAGIILAVIVLVYPLPNYLVHVGLRQSYPVEWIMLLLGCALLVDLLEPKVRSRRGWRSLVGEQPAVVS